MTVNPSIGYAQGLNAVQSPAATGAFVPVSIRAINVRPHDPLMFDFVIDPGTADMSAALLRSETTKLAKFFLAAMTIPEKDLWVNLSPYEKDRIQTNELANTDLGREMLAQDGMLKKLSSSLLDPGNPVGKEFWDKVYTRAKEVLGTTEFPFESMQKIWIVPAKATIFEVNNSAVLGEARLKVMLDEDAAAMNQAEVPADSGISAEQEQQTRAASIEAMREIVIPAIEKEVNEGKDFAPLRQFYGAVTLAVWYKNAVKNGVLSEVYANKKKTAGIEAEEAGARERIYQEYVEAFKKGAFNFIHEDADPVSGAMIPRKYFTGGITFEAAQSVTEVVKANSAYNFGFSYRTILFVWILKLVQIAAGNSAMSSVVTENLSVNNGDEAVKDAPRQVGGLRLKDILDSLAVDRAKGIKVNADPDLINQLKAKGLDGFRPLLVRTVDPSGVLSDLKVRK